MNELINYDNIVREVAVIHADIEANCIQHGTRGILEHRDIERMIAEYDDEDKQARVYGRFQHLTGLVFKSFMKKIHVIKPFPITKRDFTVYERFDPHPRNADAVGWYAVNKYGQKFVIDELRMNGTTAEIAAEIRKRDDLYRIEDRKADPWIFNKDQHFDGSVKSIAREFEDEGLYYTPASKQRTQAIQKIKDAIQYQEVGERLVQLPDLWVFNTCVEHIWEFEHWQYHEYKGKQAEYKSRSEKPQDKDDHMMECLGRFLIEDPQFIIYVQESYNRDVNIDYGDSDSLDPFD